MKHFATIRSSGRAKFSTQDPSATSNIDDVVGMSEKVTFEEEGEKEREEEGVCVQR